MIIYAITWINHSYEEEIIGYFITRELAEKEMLEKYNNEKNNMTIKKINVKIN